MAIVSAVVRYNLICGCCSRFLHPVVLETASCTLAISRVFDLQQIVSFPDVVSKSVHHGNGMRELSFCLDCVVQITVNERRPELFHNAFSREVSPRTQSLHSTFQRTAVNHSFRCTDQMLICLCFVTSEPNAFEPCRFSVC